ncbi:manganese efflux pump [Thalassomonas viridans]|uniref:Manganese efflux pump n=1 Tax=Thalassomonas viridans TaxID=137584 RepID=A0AAE9Z248_9GAMM|nr:manganese efflux pump [Thalassomonas viridans]WDE05396.1 manganese efflux pump [Thalassomonas viridans]
MSAVDFICASLLMGLGVGVDVAAATFARAPQLKAMAWVLLWVIGVSLTHTLFPMLGYLLTYFSVNALPVLTPVIGIFAFLCIALYLKNELKDFACEEQQTTQEQQLLLTCGVILAVSWDALWSGPAKSAQVVGWPESWVWFSFAIVGVVVALLAITSLLLARHLGKLVNPGKTPGFAAGWLCSAVQYTVIGYFGVLALCRYSLNLDWSWWQLLLLSAVVVNAVMYLRLLKQSADKRCRQKKHHVGRYRHWPSAIPADMPVNR